MHSQPFPTLQSAGSTSSIWSKTVRHYKSWLGFDNASGKISVAWIRRTQQLRSSPYQAFPQASMLSVVILIINQWGYYYCPSFTDEDTRTPRDYLLKFHCLAKEKQALDLNPGMSDSKSNTPGTTLEIQVWSSIPWNTINIFSICQHPGWHSWQSPAWETLHNCWSPSAKYLPSLRFGAQNSLGTELCSLSSPNHPSLQEQWSCISNKENESQTGGHKWVCSYTPLVGHTLSNVRILIQECHCGLLPRTRPL